MTRAHKSSLSAGQGEFDEVELTLGCSCGWTSTHIDPWWPTVEEIGVEWLDHLNPKLDDHAEGESETL